MTDMEKSLYCSLLRLEFIIVNKWGVSHTVIEEALQEAKELLETLYPAFQKGQYAYNKSTED